MNTVGKAVDSFLNQIGNKTLAEEYSEVQKLADRVNLFAKMAMVGIGFLAVMSLVAFSLSGVLVWGGMAYLAKEVVSISANMRELTAWHEVTNAAKGLVSPNPEAKIRMARIDQITEGAPVARAVLKFLCK